MDSSTGSSSSVSFGTKIARRFQTYLDKTVPFLVPRWVATLLLYVVYFVRVFFLKGWYIVTYALAIYHLNLFIAFLSPKVDPSIYDDDSDVQSVIMFILGLPRLYLFYDRAYCDNDESPKLPTSNSEEFRPFIRRLPEFKFWYSATKAILIATFCTFFEAFNIPVFWPILVMYFIILFTLTMKRQIKHMIKYRYLPFTHGKTKYKGKEDTGKVIGSS